MIKKGLLIFIPIFVFAQNWSPVKTVHSGAETLIDPGVAVLKTSDGKTGIIMSAIDHWEGKDYWRYVVGWNMSPQGDAIWTDIGKVSSGGNELVGGGVAVADINNNGIPDVVLAAIDTWEGKDYWRFVVGTDLDPYGKANWGNVKTVSSGGDQLVGGGVALGDIDGNGKIDIVLAAIDTWKGKDYWRFVIGWDLSVTGDANWTTPKTVYSGAQTLVGGGVALADIDGNGKLDIILAAIDHWEGKDYWRYTIGWNVSSTGEANWTQVKTVTSGGQDLSGGDIALIDLNGNGKLDIILTAIDTWEGKDYWRYAIGWDVNQYGDANWSTIDKVYGGGEKLLGGKVAVGELTGDGKLNMILTAIDTWKGKDYWRYVIGTGFGQ
jgi:hypothetical protein